MIPLIRPDPPAPDLAPQDEDIEECGLYGLQSWVDGSAIAVGDQIVILGDQRVVAEGICDEDFQFLWTSSNGLEWNLVPRIGIDGYLTGIIWTGDQYVGYGSPRPSYLGDGGPAPQIWTSADLGSWVKRPMDMRSLPEDGQVRAWPRVVVTSPGLTLTYDVLGHRPGLDSSLTDVGALERWLIEAGHPEFPEPADDQSLELMLDNLRVDFPLDAAEIELLNGFYDLEEPLGTLTLTSVNSTDWEVSYTSD